MKSLPVARLVRVWWRQIIRVPPVQWPPWRNRWKTTLIFQRGALVRKLEKITDAALGPIRNQEKLEKEITQYEELEKELNQICIRSKSFLKKIWA